MTEAIKIIQREHRALAAVVHTLDHVLEEVKAGALEPDFELFENILTYVTDFPDRYHHPKEDDFLFAALSKRDPGARKVIHDLKEQHKDGERQMADLRWKLEDWKKDPKGGGFDAFYAAAKAYIEGQRKHMGMEEQKVIPAARKHLTENDWREIDAAFEDNDDPLFGSHPRKAFDNLFGKIVALAPAPWGLGERKKPEEVKLEDTTSKYRQELVNLHWI